MAKCERCGGTRRVPPITVRGLTERICRKCLGVIDPGRLRVICKVQQLKQGGHRLPANSAPAREHPVDLIKNTRWYYVRVSHGESRHSGVDVPLRVEIKWRSNSKAYSIGYDQPGMPLKTFREIAAFVEEAAIRLGGTR